MGFPILLILGKKIVAFGIRWAPYYAVKWSVYLAAKEYGVSRLYRRMSEANRVITSNKADRAKVQEGLRSVFRFPGQAYGALQNTELMEFWRKFRAGTWGGNGEKPLPIPLLTAIDRAVSGSRAGVKPPESPLS